jgi:hypothetical protein
MSASAARSAARANERAARCGVRALSTPVRADPARKLIRSAHKPKSHRTAAPAPNARVTPCATMRTPRAGARRYRGRGEQFARSTADYNPSRWLKRLPASTISGDHAALQALSAVRSTG